MIHYIIKIVVGKNLVFGKAIASSNAFVQLCRDLNLLQIFIKYSIVKQIDDFSCEIFQESPQLNASLAQKPSPWIILLHHHQTYCNKLTVKASWLWVSLYFAQLRLCQDVATCAQPEIFGHTNRHSITRKSLVVCQIYSVTAYF